LLRTGHSEGEETMKLALVLTSLLATAVLVEAAPEPAQARLAPYASGISWSSKFPGLWTWNGAVSEAASWVENGYSDWRLPTVAEIQASIGDGSLQAVWTDTGTSYIWSSETQGSKYAFSVKIVADSSGVIDVNKSGAKTRMLKGDAIFAHAVRP
jgi:hypothetical protein